MCGSLSACVFVSMYVCLSQCVCLSLYLCVSECVFVPLSVCVSLSQCVHHSQCVTIFCVSFFRQKTRAPNTNCWNPLCYYFLVHFNGHCHFFLFIRLFFFCDMNSTVQVSKVASDLSDASCLLNGQFGCID